MNTPVVSSRSSDILKALGIKKLYWVDDYFHKGDERETLMGAAANALAQAAFQGASLTEISPALTYLTGSGLSQPEMENLARQHFDEQSISAENLTEILKAFNALSEGEVENDLASGQFARFEELLGAGQVEVTKMSFGQWQQRKAELNPNSESLFLIDYENTRESNGITGDFVLDHLATLETAPFSIVFTHVCEPEGEQSKAADVHKQMLKRSNGKPYRQFSVMSKKRLRQEEQLDHLDQIIAPSLKRLAIGHTYRQVAAVCFEGYKKGGADALDKLDTMPVDEMYRAIFERTWEEGASEIDVVCRIINAAQRKAMFDEVNTATKKRDGNFFPVLTALRTLVDISIGQPPSEVDPYISELHNVEMFDSDIINSMHIPLSCGDLFQKLENNLPTGPTYILLAPPCDLMVRSDDADRNVSEGIFVSLRYRPIAPEVSHATHGNIPVEQMPAAAGGDTEKDGAASAEVVASAEQAGPASTTVVGQTTSGATSVEGVGEESRTSVKKCDITIKGGEIAYADFHQPFAVNLLVLDFCVWNASGEVRFNRANPPRESGRLLEGWLNRFKHVKSKCSVEFPYEYRTLSFVSGPADFKVRESKKHDGTPVAEIAFPLKRIGRLRSPYAEAVLNAYLASLNRPAFDHPLVGRSATSLG